jgi:hypothetical protein
MSACSGLKLKDVPQTLEKVVNMVPGPCGEKAAEALEVCEAAIGPLVK